jgi:hypothetical protein
VADVTIDVRSLDDAGEVLAAAGPFLASEPVLHNVVLTLLHARVATPEVGRYWVAGSGRSCVGVGFQSPLHFVATLTPMPDEAVLAMVDAIVASGVRLPGVSAVAATAAASPVTGRSGPRSRRCRCRASASTRSSRCGHRSTSRAG